MNTKRGKPSKSVISATAVTVVVVAAIIIGSAVFFVAHSGLEIASHQNNQSSSQTLSCAKTYANGAPLNTGLYLSAIISSVNICVKYYYYNATSTLSISPLSLFSILGTEKVPGSNSSRTYNADSMFRLSTNVTQMQLGGPSVENEGIPLAYSISVTNSTPSGVYFITIQAVLYPQKILCGTVFQLVVGNASFSPGGSGECVNYDVPSLNQYGFQDGTPYVNIYGTTDATS